MKEQKIFLNNDPFYINAFNKGYNIDQLGYFKSSWSDYPKVEFISDSNKVILFTTGGFAPFHTGHNEMLKLAKSYFENLGKTVENTIVVVDSQDYANTKDMMISYQKRLDSIPKEYIACDFERNKSPINFTYYFCKLQKEYPEHLIVYVCGDDNGNFAPLVEDFGKMIVVNRKNPEFKSPNKNTIFLQNNKFNMLNSTDIRKKDTVLIRNDFKESFLNNDELATWFTSSLVEIFKSDLKENIKIVNVKDQLNNIPEFNYPTISLDKYYKATFNLNVSRHFKIGDSIQEHGYKLDCTTTSLNEELDIIKNCGFNEFILIDDDSVSGETVNKISKLLNVKFKDYYFLSSGYKDVLDIRDFIIGSKNGGLVFSNNEITYRAPYIYPFVNLTKRALFNNPIKISLEVIELNRQLYNKLEKLPEKPKMFNNFLKYFNLNSNINILLDELKILCERDINNETKKP